MNDQTWERDDELLAELGDALRSAGPLSASHVEGQAAWSRREKRHLEIARLTLDSLLADSSSLRDVQNASARMLTFVTDDQVSLEVELNGNRLVGQIFPYVPGIITSVTIAGPEQNAEIDDVGCFSIEVPTGPFRLRFDSPEVIFVTDWMRL